MSKNDNTVFNFILPNILSVINNNYNKLAVERGWEQMKEVRIWDDTENRVAIPCKIVGFIGSDTYGKRSFGGNSDD